VVFIQENIYPYSHIRQVEDERLQPGLQQPEWLPCGRASLPKGRRRVMASNRKESFDSGRRPHLMQRCVRRALTQGTERSATETMRRQQSRQAGLWMASRWLEGGQGTSSPDRAASRAVTAPARRACAPRPIPRRFRAAVTFEPHRRSPPHAGGMQERQISRGFPFRVGSLLPPDGPCGQRRAGAADRCLQARCADRRRLPAA